MEPKNYIVVKIEGEYAYLHEIEGKNNDDLFIALALLPSGRISGLNYTVNFFNIHSLNKTCAHPNRMCAFDLRKIHHRIKQHCGICAGDLCFSVFCRHKSDRSKHSKSVIGKLSLGID